MYLDLTHGDTGAQGEGSLTSLSSGALTREVQVGSNGAWFIFPKQLRMVWPKMSLNSQGCLEFKRGFLCVFRAGRA